METLGRLRTIVREHLPHVWAARTGWRPGASARWFTILAMVSALAVPVVMLTLRPSPAQAARMGFCLAISGLTSIALAVGARWLTDRRRLDSVHAHLHAPVVLAALVIAVNVVLLARLLFFSRQDVELLLAFVAFGIAVALALASPIAGRITRAVARIEGDVGRIAAGEYGFRIAEDGSEAGNGLTHLTRLINQMATGLEEASEERQAAEAQRRRLVTAVAHDLRTPISSIHAMVEAITDGIVTDPATLDRYHQTLLVEAWRLTALMEELFELTRLESGTFVLQREEARLEYLITDALDSVRERVAELPVTLGCQVESPLPAFCMDSKRIVRVLESLLENAVRYTRQGGMVLVRAGTMPANGRTEDVLVQVIDTGEGIAADDLPLIFEPTYRADASRKRECMPAGVTSAEAEAGLGLSIAARIVEAHGGRIWAVSPLPPETRAQVTFATGCSDAVDALPGTMLNFTLPVTSPETANTLPRLSRQ
jgi:signal transduction histidine kinase